MSLWDKYILHRGGVKERIISAEHKFKPKISNKKINFLLNCSKKQSSKTLQINFCTKSSNILYLNEKGCVCIIPVQIDKENNKEKIYKVNNKLKFYWTILFLKIKEKET